MLSLAAALSPSVAFLLFAGPAAPLDEGASVEPPEDAVMGDGLRLSEPTPLQAPPSPDTICASGGTIKGIDISKWQADVDWGDVAADGIDFSFVRVSDGINTKDQFFDDNWKESRDAGIYTGVYQFFRPNQSVLGQADYLLEKMGCDLNARTCPITSMDLPPVIDVEYRPSGWSKKQMQDSIRTWIDRVEEFGLEPIVYSGRFFWRDNVGSDEWGAHPFWIAHYTNNACPNIPTDWATWDFWQYSDKGSVDGVSGSNNTDVNIFNGDINMLKALRPSDADTPPPEACGTVVADDATIIDNSSECFALHGPNQYWRSEGAGHGGDLSWTRTTTGKEYNFGIWSLNFAEAGNYTIQAHIDPDHTTASAAKYEITGEDGKDTATVDQRDGGWVTVGTFAFEEGAKGQQVRLSDQQSIKSQQLQFDAIRLVPEGLEVEGDDCGEAVHSGSSRIDVDRGDAESCSVGGRNNKGVVVFAGLFLLGLFRRQRR